MLTIPLKQFLNTPVCPPEWLEYDLYLFRNETTVFYVGQSELAFARVWRHLHDGFKGRSLVGKFVRVNWPRSMNFVLEFYTAQAVPFVDIAQDRLAAEAHLIRRHQPCFNATLNPTPMPIPAGYRPPTAVVQAPRSIRHMMLAAETAMHQVQNRSAW